MECTLSVDMLCFQRIDSCSWRHSNLYVFLLALLRSHQSRVCLASDHRCKIRQTNDCTRHHNSLSDRKGIALYAPFGYAHVSLCKVWIESCKNGRCRWIFSELAYPAYSLGVSHSTQKNTRSLDINLPQFRHGLKAPYLALSCAMISSIFNTYNSCNLDQ